MVDSSSSFVRARLQWLQLDGPLLIVFICLVLLLRIFNCRFLISADFSPFLDLPLLSLPPLMPCSSTSFVNELCQRALSTSFVNELCQRALDEQMLISSTN